MTFKMIDRNTLVDEETGITIRAGGVPEGEGDTPFQFIDARWSTEAIEFKAFSRHATRPFTFPNGKVGKQRYTSGYEIPKKPTWNLFLSYTKGDEARFESLCGAISAALTIYLQTLDSTPDASVEFV